MKTIFDSKKVKVVLSVMLYLVGLLFYSCGGQINNLQQDQYLITQLTNLPAKTNKIQKDKVVSNWQRRNIDGAYINSNTAAAEYTTGLENGYVRWGNILEAENIDITKPAPDGKLLDFAEGFTYKVTGDNIFKEEMYKNIPAGYKTIIQWLVWDAVGIETYGLMYLDSLKLNIPFQPGYFNSNLTCNIENLGTIGLKSLVITWVGNSKMNGKNCAVIQYQSFFNPVDAVNNGMKIKGRSLYWGTIWISLDEPQVECGALNEDLPMELTIPGVPEKQLIDLQRQVEFTKVSGQR